MAVFRDFDYPIRINGDLTLPSSYNLSVGGNVTVTGSVSGATINATSNLQEAGTNLSAKYLGLTATASDSNMLDALDSTSFMRTDVNTSTTGTLTVTGGTLTLNNATSNLIKFGAYGIGSPTATGGAGMKFDLYGTGEYGLGIESASMWYTSDTNHKWYTQNGGTGVPTNVMSLNGSGKLSLLGDILPLSGNNNFHIRPLVGQKVGLSNSAGDTWLAYVDDASNSFKTLRNTVDDGSGNATFRTITSNVAQGTAPFTVTSNIVVTNFNADMVDGYHLNQGVQTTNSPTFAGLTLTGALTTNGTIYSATVVNLTTSAFGPQGLNLGSLNINATYANSTPPTNGIYSLGGIVTGNDGVFAGRVYVKNGPTDNNGGLELGRTDATVCTPFVDFHSSGNNIDYDARIIASGGNTATGNGTLNIIATNLQVNSSNVYHTGNLSPVTTGPNQTTGTGFTVGGAIYLGTGTTSGDVIVKDAAGTGVIHLDGDSSGKIAASSTLSYIAGNGNASFSGTVSIGTLAVTANTLVTNLNAERVNSVAELDLAKNLSILDGSGYGVFTGLAVSQHSPTPDFSMDIAAGTVYTNTGRRIVYPHATFSSNIALQNPNASFNRIDVLYVQGSAGGANEGRITVMTGVAASPAVEPSIPADAVKLAVITVRQSSAAVVNTDIADARKWRPIAYSAATNTLNLNATNLAVGGSIQEGGVALTAKYVQLGTSGVPVNNSMYGRTTITSSGTMNTPSGINSGYLRVTDGANSIGITKDEIFGTASIWLQANVAINLNGTSTSVNASGYLKASKNATTLSFNGSTTTQTWTHNYGNTSYAVSLSANAFNRHIAWTNKTANTIDIIVDDGATVGVAFSVDVVLIGY